VTPSGSEVVVIASVAFTVIDSDRVAACPSPLRTRAVKVDVPGVVGVPLSVPPVPSERPPGSDPPLTDQV
jgi:hypothetical protein